MSGAWKTISVALEATTAGYVGGMTKASAVTSKFGAEAEKARLQAEKPPSAAGWEAFATKTEALGKKMTKNVTVPILAFGAAAVASAVQLDGAYHTIEQRTGATGAKLQGLKKDFDAVNATSGASMSHIADVMSQFNQRLGLSGAPLQAFTRDFLVLERVAGAGAPTVEQAATVMVAWKVATDQQAGTLDKLFVASQRTGVPMNTLIDDVTRFAPQMRAAGMSIDDTTVLMGTLEKAGVPVSKVFMGINTYLSKVAKSGEDTHGAFQKIIDQAAGMDKAGQRVQATTLLVEAFGSRAGLTISQMVADGKLSGPVFDALSKQIEGAQGQIQKVGDATVPLSVRLKQAWKSVELAIAPIGNIIIPDLMGALHGVVPIVEGIAHAFSSLPKPVQEWAVGLLAAAAAVGPLMTMASKVATGFSTMGSAITTVGLEVGAFAESAGVALGSVGAAIGLLLLPLAAVGIAWAVWDDGQRRHRQEMKETSDALSHLHSLMQARPDLSTDQGFDAAVFQPWIKAYNDYLGLSDKDLKQVRANLHDTQDQWDRFLGTWLNSGGGGIDDTFLRPIELLRKEYQQAGETAKKVKPSIFDLANATLTAGESAKQAAADVTAMNSVWSSDGFNKSKMSIADVTRGMQNFGYTAKEVAAKGFDWSQFKTDLSGLDAYRQKVSDNFTSMGALSSVPAEFVKAGYNGLKLYYTRALKQTTDFNTNLNTAIRNGLNPGAVADLITAGPEKAGPILEQLVGKNSRRMIDMVNRFQKDIAKQASLAADQARILYDASQAPGASQQKTLDAPIAMQISALTGAGAAPMTPDQLMKKLGITRTVLDRVKKEFVLNLSVSADLKPAKDDLKTLQYTIDKTSGKVNIGGVTIPATNQLAILLKKIGLSRGDVTIDGKRDPADAKLFAVINAINSGKGWVGIDADTAAALAKLGDIRTTINGIPFVGSILAAHIFATANAAEVARAANGPQVKSADGNLFESHHAQIAPAGAMRLWAEPETGGEAYIPLAASKRSRSVDIWKKTGMLLGVHGFADGGTSWVDGNAVAAPAVRALGDFITWERAVAAQNAAGGVAGTWDGSMGSVAAAQAFAAAQVGKPYSWGAVGPNAYDCSGYWSAIVNVLEGRHPYQRIFTSASLPGAAAALGLVGGLGGPVSIGDKPGSHVAGTINGVNFEATPPFVRSGPNARGAGSPFFDRTFHFGSGGGGGFGGTPSAAGGDPGAVAHADGGLYWHGKSFDVGGPLWPGWNAVRNDTGRVEHVVPAGGGWGNGGGAATIDARTYITVSANGDQAVADIVHREVIPAIDKKYSELTNVIRRKEASMS